MIMIMIMIIITILIDIVLTLVTIVISSPRLSLLKSPTDLQTIVWPSLLGLTTRQPCASACILCPTGITNV